jgi:small subunit ribosomal protein S7e
MSSGSFANKKIYKKAGEQASELEESVAKAFVELEISSKEMSAELRDLFFLSAKEVELAGKKAIVIFVPHRLHKRFQKLQSRLIRELEKKFSGKHVQIVAQRTILSDSYRRKNPGQMRPRSRTLTAVHSAILEDLVYPTAIVGKRIRFRADGSRLLKVLLDPKDVKEVDYKLKTFATVYKKLTNKNVEFMFPATD